MPDGAETVQAALTIFARRDGGIRDLASLHAGWAPRRRRREAQVRRPDAGVI